MTANKRDKNCCIVVSHPFWRERLGCGTLLRARYNLLKSIFANVYIFFITNTEEKCPYLGATFRGFQPSNSDHLAASREFFEQNDISLCYFSYNLFSGLAELINCTTVVEVHDVMHIRQANFDKFGYSAPIKMDKTDEIKSLKKYDLVFCLNTVETAYLQKNGINCVFLPPNMDFNLINQPQDNSFFGFFGSSALPNIDGIKQVKSLISSTDKFVIAGSITRNLSSETVEKNCLKNLGFVETPGTFYENINVAISPIRFGAGLKIKVFEALAHGCRVLASSHSIEGFPEGVADIVTVNDNLSNWDLRAVEQTLVTPRGSIEKYFSEHFSNKICRNLLLQAL